ncbi:AAA family ATPase [Candidatus Uhrbacteria bacterium]|nr:AAA family ATPase [Candidatus Uhrbacteria bacterium]
MLQSEALDILKTGANVFLTGEPGSGKTHVTNAYVRYLKQAKIDVAVTASTGIAATHLGGMTVHSWSGIGISKNLSNWDIDRIASNERVAKRIDRTRVLVIDEISMLDGAILGNVDRVCREVKRRDEPFGGMQVLFVGDFFQLPPVSRPGEPLAQFAFESQAWAEVSPFVCYLEEHYRQEDQTLLSILSALRNNAITDAHCTQLSTRCIADPTRLSNDTPKLYPHTVDVDRINSAELARIPGEPVRHDMTYSGRAALAEQLKRGCLSPEQLLLKKGASVMFTKNSITGAFVNGTLGVVVDFDDDTQYPIVQTRGGRTILAEPASWSLEEHGRVLAQISQVPLRLAWAITIHKSQGMSLDYAYVDLEHAFVEGQGYVALSRVRTMEGLYLSGWNQTALTINVHVLEYDHALRQRSQQTRDAFGTINPEEFSRMQNNFVVACGGQLSEEPKKKPVVPLVGRAQKAYAVDRIRKEYPNAYRAWSKADDALLTDQYTAGSDIEDISTAFGRRKCAIRSRLVKLGLIEAPDAE